MKDNRLINYFKDSFQELNKVSWPTKNQAIKLTFIVLGFIFAMAIVFGIFDFIFNTGYRELIKLRPAQPAVVPEDAAPIEFDTSAFDVTDAEGNPIPIEIEPSDGETLSTDVTETEGDATNAEGEEAEPTEEAEPIQ